MNEKAIERGHSTLRGHRINWTGKEWVYADTGNAIHKESIRHCKKCGKVFEGSYIGDPDPCLCVLPGVSNACCGHGDRESSYIVFKGGIVLKGFYVENLKGGK